MFCGNCGAKLDVNSRFCSNCGNNIYNNLATQEQNNSNKNEKRDLFIKLSLIGILTIILITLLFILFKKNNNTSQEELVENGNNSRTIMIYMVGSNLEYQSGIATADISSIDPSLVDLDNNHVYLYTGGTKKWLNFVSNNENAIYELTRDGFKKVETYDKLNMGDASTLNDLLTYGYEKSKTDRYDLVIYNHGGAIDGAIYDDFTNDNLSLNDFQKALKMSPFNEQNKLETVLFRTCLNGTLEVANVFKNYAYYMIASEEVTNGASVSSVLNYINDIKTSDTAIDYSKKYIDAYDKQMQDIDPFQFSTNPMYSILNLSKIDELNKELDNFISSVDLKNNYNNIVKVRSNLYQFATMSDIKDYDTVDLYTLVTSLKDYSKVLTDKFVEAFNAVVVYNWSSSDTAKGLSIYFPFNASSKIQNYFMGIYKDLNFSNNYYNFIKNFKNTYLSGGVTSFNKTIVNNNTEVIDNKEFILELTDEQAKDYADSIYMIFRKEKDNKYTVIYSSDNTIQDGNKLKTNISDNLIKVKIDDEETNEDYFYIPLVERSNNNKRNISFGVILENFETSEWLMDSARIYIEYENDKPKIANAIFVDKNGVSGTIANLDNYNIYAILSSHYNILDNKGNYIDNWDNEGIIQGYEFKKDELVMEKARLDDKSEYFCVFKIRDVYGNIFYSKLMSLK